MAARLDEFFFDHLASVTCLNIKAPEEGPLGLEGMSHARLALKKNQMPLLKVFQLEYVFICPELVDFLTSHAKTLEYISLQHCYGGTEASARNGICWNDLFDPLHDSNPENLRHFEISGDAPSLYDEDTVPGMKVPVPKEVQQALRILEADPRKRLFPYASLDDKYGYLSGAEEAVLASFQRGEDQASYDKLMGRINTSIVKPDDVVTNQR